MIKRVRRFIIGVSMLVTVGVICWIGLVEIHLLPSRFTRHFEADFAWDSSGFRSFHLERDPTNGSEPGGRIWQFLIAMQIKPRLVNYLRQGEWNSAEGRLSVNVAKFVPVAVPTALGSDGIVLHDPTGTTLMHAAQKDQVESVERLLQEEENVNATDQRGQTALIHACMRGTASSALVKKLLSAGANVNAVDKIGRTPLFLEVQTPATTPPKLLEKLEVVKVLLRQAQMSMSATRTGTRRY